MTFADLFKSAFVHDFNYLVHKAAGALKPQRSFSELVILAVLACRQVGSGSETIRFCFLSIVLVGRRHDGTCVDLFEPGVIIDPE